MCRVSWTWEDNATHHDWTGWTVLCMYVLACVCVCVCVCTGIHAYSNC